MSLAPRYAEGLPLVELDQDHPGFRDPVYRKRRNEIAAVALGYREGEPVPDVDFTEAENRVWQTVWEHLEPLHRKHACRQYLSAAAQLRFDKRIIPQLSEVNERLKSLCGVQMLPVAGLISARAFLERLARLVFLSTQYIRHHSVPLYTPEPDIVHELVGHAITFADPDLVELNRAFGEATFRVDDTVMVGLARVYWYTMEFGVVIEEGVPKAYGAGLLSSFGELGRLPETELRPLDCDAIAQTSYDPTQYQPTLFVASSFGELRSTLLSWLSGL